AQAASYYEQAILTEPDFKSHYWNLGLMLLLQGQAVEAQTTWLMGMMEGEAEQVEEWTAQLSEVLQAEITRREALEENSVAWEIRQQLREICPTDINNLLHLIRLAIALESYTGEELTELGVLEILRGEPQVVPTWELLMTVLRSVLDYAFWHPSTLELVEACLAFSHAETQVISFLQILVPAAIDITFSKKQPGIAVKLMEFGLRLAPKSPELLLHLAGFYEKSDDHEKAIDAAKLNGSLSETLTQKVSANHLLLRMLMAAGGYWEEAYLTLQKQKLLLESLLESQPMPLDSLTVTRLINSSFFFPYFQDSPKDFRQIQNQLAQLCQVNIESYAQEPVARYRQGHRDRKHPGVTGKPLKIGYVSYCFRNHSVGWLARSLIQHHNRDRFQLHGYFLVCDPVYDSLHQWYMSQFSQVYKSKNALETAEQIYQDEIDILIDLDSLTLDLSCEVMALKPAPIQVTWLGWDASGMPTIDYFIADSYVLPHSAQEYYTEKIWRLPQSYIAVDGFEVGVPNLHREQLEIESDAVVYLSAQKGYKRHLDTARLQMKIIKEVPNSYFLIKGWGDNESIKRFFIKLAEEQGVDCSRLRFLSLDLSEAQHRANLGIADVVLDTYPYNGATTTLETLWMGIPLVTRVGEQFAARNSYTMMMNAGITEGIAWTDEDYVEWGVRLGKDETLRQQVTWKLRQSRHKSTLWNGKQFTREIEKAYEQMWQRYADQERMRDEG
ncbi:MAG TPA: O-linked N-acetylglucosamine transferase, SPINDLY family protein, partial [Cyanobacteria bacterium UBA8553]|nr:O-linked N-acetylglucosamine transferase, SPINDLY family protein [Cyanobacteria bacterium UBA8553]